MGQVAYGRRRSSVDSARDGAGSLREGILVLRDLLSLNAWLAGAQVSPQGPPPGRAYLNLNPLHPTSPHLYTAQRTKLGQPLHTQITPPPRHTHTRHTYPHTHIHRGPKSRCCRTWWPNLAKIPNCYVLRHIW